MIKARPPTRLWVIYAAQGETSGQDRCGGPGVCDECREDLLRTGIDLAPYAVLDPSGERADEAAPRDLREGVPLGHSIAAHNIHGWCSH